MVDKKKRPLPAVGVMILKGDKVLLGYRVAESSHGGGTWCFPGGHLEFGESFKQCALREIKEECGVKVKNLRFQCVANLKKYDRHYVLIGFMADWALGEAKNLEPDRFDGWQWFSLKRLPKPLFQGTDVMIKNYKRNGSVFDS